jgi:hypothetical protein
MKTCIIAQGTGKMSVHMSTKAMENLSIRAESDIC